MSDADRANLQSEVKQLLLEVNRISQNTNFNGQALLDGSHAGFQQQVDANATITSNSNLAVGGQLVELGLVSRRRRRPRRTEDGTIEVQVAQITSTQQGLRVSFFSSASGSGSVATVITIAGGVPAAAFNIDGVTLNFGAAGTLDVGITTFVKVSQYVSAQSNPTAPAFNFQSGAAEGATIQVGFIDTSTSSLRISNVNLVGNTGFSSLASEDAIGQIDNALQTILGQRAQLGATIVRLQEDSNNNNVASVNLQASESAIRDLNVGAETTAVHEAPDPGAGRYVGPRAVEPERAVGRQPLPLRPNSRNPGRGPAPAGPLSISASCVRRRLPALMRPLARPISTTER